MTFVFSTRIGLLIVAGILLPQPSMAAKHSLLWGQSGERWTPESRLPDFSYAGYRRGEELLPERVGEVNVKDFGAKGDGRTDDTEAFQKALKAGAGKVVGVPPGRYVITDFLTIDSPGTVLKGSGPAHTFFLCPKPLNVIKPNWGATTSGRRTSNYSWSGGIVRMSGSYSRNVVGEIQGNARRGGRELLVGDASKLKVGDELRLIMEDPPERSLVEHLYAGDPGPIENLKSVKTEFTFRVAEIDAGRNLIRTDRPLRTEVRTGWKPKLYRAGSTVEEAGIEDLAFIFPNTPYQGHFTEVGFNAIAIGDARNSWCRNIRIHNADSGIFVRGDHNTLKGIVITSDRATEKQRDATGHHGVTLGGQDNLLTEFDFRTRFMHDVTMTRGSAGNVVSSGRGVDLCFDHHRYGPHANLFTDLDLGKGSRMFQSGGGAKLGRHSGAWETFWGIRSREAQSWPKGWGPDLMNIVGVRASGGTIREAKGKWFEIIDPLALSPRNLHQAQLDRRLKSAGLGESD